MKHSSILLLALVGAAFSFQSSVTIASINPAEGPIGGGTEVVIQGTGFGADSRVTFGGVAAATIRVVSATEIRAATPPSPNGFAAVVVENSNGLAVAEFLFQPPSLESIGPGQITTVAGIGRYIAEQGRAREAPLDPRDVTIDANGNVYVLDVGMVRRISPDGIISRIAGTGVLVFSGTINEIGDGGPARQASVGGFGLSIGPDQNLYVADTANNRIRRIDMRTGLIATVVGSGPVNIGAFGGDGGPATSARLNLPNQTAFDGSGNMYVLDAFNYRVRRVNADGIISTVVGTGVRGFSGDGGPATNATFDIGPNGDRGSLKATPDGTLYLCDSSNRRLRKIDGTTGIITTIAGGGTNTGDRVPALSAAIECNGVALAADGTVYFTEFSRIRRLDRSGLISTVFGTAIRGFSPDGSTAPTGQLVSAERIALADSGTLLFVEGIGVDRVRSLDLSAGMITTLAGIGPAVFGENGPATRALLTGERPQIALDASNRPVWGTPNRVLKLQLDGRLTTMAGGGTPPTGRPPDQRPALGTPVKADAGLAIDADGNIFAGGEYAIDRISLDGRYQRIAGADYGYSGDGGPATQARFDQIWGLAIDRDGTIFVADTWNCVIRRIDARSNVVTTFGGRYVPHPANSAPDCRWSGVDGIRAVDSDLAGPMFLTIDFLGNVYFNDRTATRMINRDGIVTTVLANCRGPMTTDNRGRVYIYCFNAEIRRIDGPGQSTLIGRLDGTYGFSGDGGPAERAQARDVSGIAVDASGNVYLHDIQNRRVRVVKEIAR